MRGKRYKRYQRYLKSNHWKSLSARARERDGFKCCHCGSPYNLNVHHISYHKDLKRVPLDQLLTLCESCHEREHLSLKFQKQQHNIGVVSRLTRILFYFDADTTNP